MDIPSPNKNQLGMTLIEVLIAISLLAMISLGITSLMTGSLVTTDEIKAEDQDRLSIETFFNRFEYDFQHQYSPLFFSNIHPKFLGFQNIEESELPAEEMAKLQAIRTRYQSSERFSFPSTNMLPIAVLRSNQPDEFTFIAESNNKFSGSEPGERYSRFHWVRYSVGPSEREGVTGNSIFRESWPANLYYEQRPEGGPPTVRYAVLDHVISFSVTFWNPENREFIRNLNEIPGGEHFLRAIKIDLAYQNIYEQEEIYSRIYRPLFPFFIPESQDEIGRLQSAAGIGPGAIPAAISSGSPGSSENGEGGEDSGDSNP